MENNKKILLTAVPTLKNPQDASSVVKTTSFIEDIKNTQILEEQIDTQKLFLGLKARGKLPESFNLQGYELTTAFKLHSMGTEATEIFEKTFNSTLLNDFQKEQLYRAGFIMSALEDLDQERFGLIRDANLNPKIQINEAPPQIQYPQANQMLFSIQENILRPTQPFLEKGVRRLTEPVVKKLESYTLKAFEKGGQKIAQGLFKKAATKGTQQAVSKGLIGIGGKTIGAILGTALPLPPVVQQIVGAVLGWLAEKVLKPILKGIKSFLEAITGEKDLRKQLAWLGGVGLLTGIFIGSTPLMLISGALGLGSLASITSVTIIASGFFASLSAAVGAFLSIILASILVPVLIMLVIIPVSTALILFIINSGAYVVPRGGFNIADYPGDFTGENIECSLEKGLISFDNSTTSSIASRAWEITRDLYQGFWCFWNRSPDDSSRLNQLIQGGFPPDEVLFPPSYPQYFNEEFYVVNPNPTIDEVANDHTNLFWCTILVVQSYRETGYDILIAYRSDYLENWFKGNNRYIEAHQATSSNIPPGSVIFFYVIGGPVRTNHVAIVHHTIPDDAIVYVQSNSGLKDSHLAFEDDGVGVINPPRIEVRGFGIP